MIVKSYKIFPFLVFAAFLAISTVARPSSAQLVGDTTVPGDDCSALPSGASTMVADSDGNFKDVILICDGAFWRSAGFTATEPLEYSSASYPYVVVSNDALGALGAIDGTYSNYPSEDVGMIAYTSTGKVFIGFMDDTASLLTGMWSNGYESYIGQSYSADDFSNFSGIHMRDQSRFELQSFGTTTFASTGGRVFVGNDSNTANGTNFQIKKGRGDNAVQTGDQLGGIEFVGKYQYSTNNVMRTNSGFSIPHALIQATVEPGTIDSTVPTKLAFHTTPATGALAERMVISSEGFVGIGDPSPSVALDIVGDIHYTGVIQDVSDQRLKENVAALEGSLEGLLRLNGYSFTMKGDDAAVVEYGFMAQEVEPVFPELVTTQDDGFKSMNYIGLIAPLVEATKAQQALIEAQQSQINNLKARLEALESN